MFRCLAGTCRWSRNTKNSIAVALGLLEPKHQGFTVNLYISTWPARNAQLLCRARNALKKCPVVRVPYREHIGKLLYLAVATRPDIAYIVGVLCRFVENLGKDHWLAAKRVLRYLKGTVHIELVYSHTGSPDLFTTYADADLSGNPDNSRSTGSVLVGLPLSEAVVFSLMFPCPAPSPNTLLSPRWAAR